MFLPSKILSQNFNTTAKIVVNQGGTWSGKTYGILETLILRNIESKSITTVVGEDIPNLKKGAIRDIKKIIDDNSWLNPFLKGDSWEKAYNISDRILTFKNKSQIEFTSYENEQDARSGKRDYLFINEANGIDYTVYWQLFIRTEKQTFIDYNPSARFWVHDHVLIRPDCELIISDHRQNVYISDSMHREIESIEDPELFKVYARGATGIIKGLVFSNWRMVDVWPEECDNWCYGMDFGYSNSHTALVKAGVFLGELYMQELIYERALQNEDILIYLKTLGVDRNEKIMCDSADPKTRDWLRAKGYNIHGAAKGPDSINYGLGLMKGYRINLTSDSTNLKKEFERYKYKVNSNGEMLNEPEKKFDHGIDAGRYAFMELLEETGFYFK